MITKQELLAAAERAEIYPAQRAYVWFSNDPLPSGNLRISLSAAMTNPSLRGIG